MSVLTDTHWAATLHLNVVRALSATVALLVLFPVGLAFGVVKSSDFGGVFVLPMGLLVIGLMVILTLRSAGAMGVPFMQPVEGIMTLMMIAFIGVGDPLIWFARKRYPNIVPVRTFRPLNFHAVILVQKDNQSEA